MPKSRTATEQNQNMYSRRKFVKKGSAALAGLATSIPGARLAAGADKVPDSTGRATTCHGYRSG